MYSLDVFNNYQVSAPSRCYDENMYSLLPKLLLPAISNISFAQLSFKNILLKICFDIIFPYLNRTTQVE